MKTKKFEKLESFKLKNEKLETILGGEGAPVKSFYSFDVQATGAGETCELASGQCLSYSSDILNGPDDYVYFNVNAVDKPC
ncbi:hypothetical protein JI747_002320 [Chryseobacterium sp. RG1]|uniref:Natural product n=1 Tax=Chryseobacterium tagetis TaxID=2801334 RepID=A0ABS7ZW84_9FLAO|nr:hypothetical protein [Chryseobacterium tagetis]MCA6065994.1 hypothetical protein [Chryseobacterium tagetis]